MKQKSMKAGMQKRQPKLLMNNGFTIGWELREKAVPETMVNSEGKTVPFVPKFKESIKGGYQAYKAGTKTLLKASLLFLIFFLPTMAYLFYGYGAILNHYTAQYREGCNYLANVGIGYGNTLDIQGVAISAELYAKQLFLIGFVICNLFTALGMAGLFTVAKKLIWNENPKKIAKYFFKGIKDHWYKYLFFVTLGSLIALAMGSSLIYLLDAQAMKAANAGHYCACVFTFIFGVPPLIFSMAAITLIPSYKLSFGELIKDSFIVGFNRFLQYFLNLAISCIPIVLLFINNIIAIILVIVYIGFGFSLWAMLWTGLGHGSYLKCVYLSELTNKAKEENLMQNVKKADKKDKNQTKANEEKIEGTVDKPQNNNNNNKKQGFQNPKKKKKK